MAALEIARVNLLRLVRDRTNLFFVFLLPLIIVVGIGAAFGGAGASRMGLVRIEAGTLGDELVARITDAGTAVEVRERESLDQLREAVERGDVEAGLLIPPGFDAAVRAGRDVELVLVARPDDRFGVVSQAVEAAVARQAALVRAARVAADHAAITLDEALGVAREREAARAGIEVRTATVGEGLFDEGFDAMAVGAQSQTVLFMFLTSLTAATQLLLTRQLGVSRRMLATPTVVRSILVGELAGRFAVAMLQGLFIVLVSALVFGVTWGDPSAAAAVIVLFALVGTGAAMIVGGLARDPDQAGALAVVLGLVLGALGGAMVPIELFPEPMASLALATPHAWALGALRDLVSEGAGLAHIALELAVLGVYATVLVGLGVWVLRRTLTRS